MMLKQTMTFRPQNPPMRYWLRKPMPMVVWLPRKMKRT